MKKITYKEKIILIILLLYAILYNPIFSQIFRANLTYFNLAFWIIIAIISYLLIGYIKCRSIVKKDTIQIIVIFTITYLILTYLLGIIIGFQNTPFSLKIWSLLSNIVPFIIYVITKEITRYILICKSKQNKKYIYIVTLVYILIDIAVSSISYDFQSPNEIFRFLGITVLGSGFKNVLLSYISLNSDFTPCIVYNIIMEGYIYIVPFIPNLGEYLETMSTIIFPVIIILYLSKMYELREKDIKRRVKLKNRYWSVPAIILTLILMALISGVFKYKIYAIASNSMKPTFSRGDAIIIEKFTGAEEIKKGDIIAFQHENKIYVHRVVKIKKYNNSLYYTTKGDNNNTNDDFDTNSKDVLGIVHFYLPLIGYPTVWFSETLNR